MADSEKQILDAARIPPQAVEIEKAVLGAILLDKNAIVQVTEFLRPEDFYATAHQKIFAAMIDLFEKEMPIDLLTLSEELKRRNELEAVGGAYYLSDLSAMVPSAANLEQHVRILRDKALTRKLIFACNAILKEAYGETEDVESLIGAAQQAILDISKAQQERGYVHLKEVINETIGEVEKQAQRKDEALTGIRSGYRSLDSYTAGFQNGDLIILAGRPSMGKTAFALNIARNVAVELQKPVGIFSLEMSSMQLAQRLICMETRIESQRLRTGRLRKEEWRRLAQAAGRLADAPIFIDDTPGLNVMRLSSRARRMALEQNIQLLIIDYLQLMEAHLSRSESRQQEIAFISRSLKGLAKNLNVPIIALSQLTRAVENRPDKRPMLADLRESGAIEQDADLVMFVFREEVYARDLPEEKRREVHNRAEIIIGKHRNGPIGTVNLTFLKEYGLFSELPSLGEEEVEPVVQVDF
ncbi:MAG: replicative DNA helicase [Calditrichaeota bacterium]|nr:MAG: replicative DNA helicase [Calditrichota bacterium]